MSLTLDREAVIEANLAAEKMARDDTSSYIGNLLIRQRMVNYQVISFCSDLLRPGSLVIDACAGPEGSLLAASLHGYRWVGNDISTRFANRLMKFGGRNVVLSDFSQAPFRNNVADGIFFIFALNNITRPESAFREATRVLKPTGFVIETEPGPTTWIGKIIFHTLLQQSPAGLVNQREAQEVFTYFDGKPYTAREYTEFFLRNTTGTTWEEMAEVAKSAILFKKGEDRPNFRFHQELLRRYFQHMQQASQLAGLELHKAGVYVIAQNERQEWEVVAPIEVNTNNWLEELMLLRKSKGLIYESLPSQIKYSPKRMFCPILAMRKI